jgi:hypothetical protein
MNMGKVSSRDVHHAMAIPGQVEHQYVDWSLLDTDKGCPRDETQP